MNVISKKEKLLDAAVAILRTAPGYTLKTVVLNKALFYVDLVSLRDSGKIITEATYVALKNGPVIAHYEKRLIAPLGKSGFAEQTERGDAKPVKLSDDIFPRYLTPSEIEVVQHVVPHVAKFSSSAVSDWSHENPGWKAAYNAGLGSGGKAQPIDMYIALQQIIEPDNMWFNEPVEPKSFEGINLNDPSEQPW